MLLIKCLNFEFLYSLKLYMKNKFMDWIINNILLKWNLTRVLRIYRKYYSTDRFSKYIVILIFLLRVIALGYNYIYNQTLSLNFGPLKNILGS